MQRKHLSGAGGNWKTIDEALDSSVVRQINDLSCVAAVGEMLLAARSIQISQAEIISAIGAPSHSQRLSDYLNQITGSGSWRGGFVNLGERELSVLDSGGSWGAVLREGNGLGHMVFVEETGENDLIKIRDPFEGTSYLMERKDFLELLSEAVFNL